MPYREKQLFVKGGGKVKLHFQIYKNYKKINICANTKRFCTKLGRSFNLIILYERHLSHVFSVVAMATTNAQIVN